MPGRTILPILLIFCFATWPVPWTSQGRQARAQGATVAWQPLGGPGGRISLLASNPQGSELFATSVASVRRGPDQTQRQNGGAMRRSDALYRSRDGGTSWQPATNNLPPAAITALFLDSQSGSVYLGLQPTGPDEAQAAGLWVSTDRGIGWRQVSPDTSGIVVRAITRDAEGRYLLVGGTGLAEGSDSVIYRSEDSGQTWRSFPAPRHDEESGNSLTGLVGHPAVAGRLFLTTAGGDVYVSSDAGETWSPAQDRGGEPLERAESGPAYLAVSTGPGGVTLTASGSADGPVPFGAEGRGGLRIRRSTDAGQTWETISPSGLVRDTVVAALAALPANVFLLATDVGAYRSTDAGATWQLLEGPLNSSSVASFAAPAGAPRMVLAATGYGLFVSHDRGALWQRQGNGLPWNSAIMGLLTDARQPQQVLAVPADALLAGTARPPAILRSTDGGRNWSTAALGLPAIAPTAWAGDPADPGSFFLSAGNTFYQSTDAGLTWKGVELPPGRHRALSVAASDPAFIFLGGDPALRSTDAGATWEGLTALPLEDETQPAEVTGTAIDPSSARHLWASAQGGVFESADGGDSWRPMGLEGKGVDWLVVSPPTWLTGDIATLAGFSLYAGVRDEGIYRWNAQTRTWTPSTSGIPPGSTILSLIADPRTPGVLWASREGGGLYHSTDRGEAWSNVGEGTGDNLGLSWAIDFSAPGHVLMGTATAGIWLAREAESAEGPLPSGAVQQDASPEGGPKAVDARIEIVWPHGWAPVTEAQKANIGLRLFRPDSLLQPSCSWSPEVTVWQATNQEPAEPLDVAEQRVAVGQSFPYWELNDVDVSQAQDPQTKLYFMIQVEGKPTATSVWVHGVDARTIFPFQDMPSGLATSDVTEIDSRVQVVWPHDESGKEQSVTAANYVNVAVALFAHGTSLSVPVDWGAGAISLYGAWNNESGRVLARGAVAQVRRAGAITYPVWEFNNIPVSRAADPNNKLHLWVMVDGLETYPGIWTHGADARTVFPAQDEPIQGCGP